MVWGLWGGGEGSAIWDYIRDCRDGARANDDDITLKGGLYPTLAQLQALQLS